MEFKENEDCFITIPKYQNVFIYFLINDNEVVYVGQTKNGIIRPFSHKEKLFNKIKIFYCNVDDLDKLENEFILKYKPKYNIVVNRAMRYGFQRAKTLIRKKFNSKTFTLRNLKKYIYDLGIKIDVFNGIPTIDVFDFYKICKEIENEVYNRGF